MLRSTCFMLCRRIHAPKTATLWCILPIFFPAYWDFNIIHNFHKAHIYIQDTYSYICDHNKILTNFNDHLLISWPALSTSCHYSFPLIQASIWQRKLELFKLGIFSKTSTVNVAIITRVVWRVVWRKWRYQHPSHKNNVVFSFFCLIFSNECQLTDQCLIISTSQIEYIIILTNYCNLCNRRTWESEETSQKHMFSKKLPCIRQNSSKNLKQWCLLFFTIKYDSMYSKRSAKFIDLNASTELVELCPSNNDNKLTVSVCFFLLQCKNSHLLGITGPQLGPYKE